MISKVLKRISGCSVEVKLTSTLVLVVVITTGVLLTVQYLFAERYLEEHAQEYLQGHLQHMINLVGALRIDGPDLRQALRRALRQAQKHPLVQPLEGKTAHTYGLDSHGNVVVPPRSPGLKLPPLEVLRRVAASGWGVLHLQIQGAPALLVYDRLPSGDLMLVVQSLRSDYLSPTLDALLESTILAALALAVLVAICAVLLARWVLSKPLKHLTAEAERVASGDLTPPQPLAGRDDELGRLSLALNHMTLAAQRMVAQAQAEHTRFLRLFNDSKDGAFIINEQGRLEDINPAGLQMFGYQEQRQMLGLDSTQSLFADQQERKLYLDTLWAQGYVQDFPVRLLRCDGSSFEALVTANSAGRGKARFGLIRDVTRMRAAQRDLAESEARYRRLVDNAPDIIYRWSFENNAFDYISSAAQEISGYSPRRLMNSPELFWQVVHPQDRKAVAAHWRRRMRGRGPAVSQQELRIINAEGATRWLRERSILVRDELDHPVALEGIATDITELKLLQQELTRGQQMVEATLQGLPAAVMVIDQQHKVVHWNRAMENLSGMPAAEVVGSNRQWQPFFLEPRPLLADLVLDGDEEQIKKYRKTINLKTSKLIAGGLEGEGFYPALGKNGRHLYFLAAPILDQEGRVVRAVETLVDLTDKRELEQELIKLSVTDSLTGLYNQRFFYATLEREIETAQRLGHPLSLLMADIDHFKAFNDSYGHLAGDRALTQFAETVNNSVRGMDLSCRYGGEEFTVLLPHAALSEALGVAERVRAGVAARPFAVNNNGGPGGARHLTVSLGAATLGPGEDMQGLVRRADAALYAAKEDGRNLVAASLFEGGVRVLARGSTGLNQGPPP